jgi:hypothetical protein
MSIQIRKLDPTTFGVSAALLRRIGPASSLALALLASAFVFLDWLSSGAGSALAQGPMGYLNVQANPASISASGLSTTTLSATVLDEAGQPVPDGTAVVFSSTLGYLDNWTQLYTTTTTGGVAVAVLNSAPSGATVTATVSVSAGAVAGDVNIPFLTIPCQEDLTSWQQRPIGHPGRGRADCVRRG